MPKHNSGRDNSGQGKTKKKRQADQGKRGHVNKYEAFSHAAQEQAKIARQGETALNMKSGSMQFCNSCQKLVRHSDWSNHPCNWGQPRW